MEFDWDEGNIDKNLVKHNVHDWEIEEAMVDQGSIVTVRRVVRAEQRRILLGRVATSGRYLKVVFAVRIRNDVTYYRPISAVDMSDHEKNRYRQRQ